MTSTVQPRRLREAEELFADLGFASPTISPDDPAQEAAMRARFPLPHVDRIDTPLLIARGENYARVQRTESDAIVASLRERGVAVRYRLAGDEGHGFGTPGT